MTHEQQRWLASYVLGALSPTDRRQLDAHLPTCPACREELATYAGLPGLLSRLDLVEATGGTLLPPPTLLPAVLAAVEAERSTHRRRLMRWRTVAAGSSAVVAAAAVAGVLAVTGGEAAPERQPLVAAAGVGASGSVSFQARPWGTELQLRLAGLPTSDGYAAYAVDDQGVRTLAARWGSTPGRSANVPATTALSPSALSQIIIETTDGALILSLGASASSRALLGTAGWP